jgi:hypothetical protein
MLSSLVAGDLAGCAEAYPSAVKDSRAYAGGTAVQSGAAAVEQQPRAGVATQPGLAKPHGLPFLESPPVPRHDTAPPRLPGSLSTPTCRASALASGRASGGLLPSSPRPASLGRASMHRHGWSRLPTVGNNQAGPWRRQPFRYRNGVEEEHRLRLRTVGARRRRVGRGGGAAGRRRALRCVARRLSRRGKQWFQGYDRALNRVACGQLDRLVVQQDR